MRQLYISAAVCLGLLSAGCTHYLDVKPYDRVIPKTAEDFSALLQNTLHDIDEGNSNEVVPNFSSTSTYDAVYADDFEVCLTGSGGAMLGNYIGSAITYGHFDSKYNSLYATIRDCNIIMDEIVERESDEAQKVIATSLAIRGVAYYQLLKGFCAVPEPGNYSNQLGVPLVMHFDMEEVPLRSNMQQTIQLIENDLKASIAMDMTDPLYRFTSDVCKGYLARLYFWTRQWDKALEMSQEVLKKYPLVGREEYKNMMADTYKLGSSQLIKCYRSLSSSSSTNALSSTITTLKSRPVSARLLNCFDPSERESDVRYPMYVNSARQAQKGIFCGMRAAEMKLIEAEAYYHLGQYANALQSINDLRALRISDCQPLKMDNLPAPLASEIIKVDVEGNALTPLMALILRERRKELFLEGDRFWELKRNGSPSFYTYSNGIKYVTESYMYTHPIPIRDLDVNPLLEQNPGYNEIVNR